VRSSQRTQPATGFMVIEQLCSTEWTPLTHSSQHLWLIVSEMAHEDVGVPDFPESPKLLCNFVNGPRDQGFCRNAAITLAQHALQHLLCLGRRLADINVAPQRDSAWLPAVSGAPLTVEIGLGSIG
jgi:hypothetical protein